jgi:hypothetical protein
MAAPLISAAITNARYTLNENTAAFWTDAELLVYANDGLKDLWRAVIDLHQGHFLTIDTINVSLAASTSTITGTPADLFRVELLEVRDQTTANTVRNMTFSPRAINHPDFSAARGLGAVDPNGREIYFAVTGAGSPVSTPAIQIAPMISSAVNLRLTYTPTLGNLAASIANPIPGDSDHALQAWIISHARAREREDRSPDPEWLAIYASDKKNLLVALTPRQTQEPDIAEALFESYWG